VFVVAVRLGVWGCNADQGGDIAARQPLQFGRFRDQARGRWPDAAYARQPPGEIGVVGLDLLRKLGRDLMDLGAGIASITASMFFPSAAGHQSLQVPLFRCRHGVDEALRRAMTRQDIAELGRGPWRNPPPGAD